MRDELFFVLTAVLALVAIGTLVAFICLRVCRVALKIVLVVVFVYAMLVLLLQIEAISQRMPKSMDELKEFVVPSFKNFTAADSLTYVYSAWQRARDAYDSLSWASELKKTTTTLEPQFFSLSNQDSTSQKTPQQKRLTRNP